MSLTRSAEKKKTRGGRVGRRRDSERGEFLCSSKLRYAPRKKGERVDEPLAILSIASLEKKKSPGSIDQGAHLGRASHVQKGEGGRDSIAEWRGVKGGWCKD